MKKFGLGILVSLLFTILAGCSLYAPPTKEQITEELTALYQQTGYRLTDGSTAHLTMAEPITILAESVDAESMTASVRLNASAGTAEFVRNDLWELRYTISEETGQWIVTDQTLVASDFTLLSDLPETLCRRLLAETTDEDFTLVSVTTDRERKTATAVYTYEKIDAKLGSLGSVTLQASVDADFAWHPDSGWQYSGCRFNEETKYLGDFSCRIESDGRGMVSTDRFSISFDLVVAGELVCIENLRYQGSVCTLGRLHIGNARLSTGVDGGTAIITFDFVRDAGNIEQDPGYLDIPEYKEYYRTVSGSGTITITTNDNGNPRAALSLPGFIVWKDGELLDFEKGDIVPEDVTAPEDGADTPQPEPEPESDPVPPYVGTWVCVAPEGLVATGTARAVLREDGTCYFACDLNIGSMSFETTYSVIDDYTKLPTNLLPTLIFGGTPTITVIYDAERDVVYTCLEKGTYLYFSREGSGGNGGFYDPAAG